MQSASVTAMLIRKYEIQVVKIKDHWECWSVQNGRFHQLQATQAEPIRSAVQQIKQGEQEPTELQSLIPQD